VSLTHGTEYGYRTHKCRCARCVGAAKRNEYARATGRAGLVPVDRVSALFTRLRAAGWSNQDIADAAGIDTGKVSKYLLKRVPTIRMSTERSILTADYTRQAPGTRVDGNGTRLRLRALAAMGWRAHDVSERTGIIRTTLAHIAGQDGAGTSAGIRDAVREVYDEVSGTFGPSTRARERALRRGWLPPLALDDDRIDDPDYVPDRSALRRRESSQANAEDVLWLLEQGETPAAVARRYGMSEASVLRYRYRRPA